MKGGAQSSLALFDPMRGPLPRRCVAIYNEAMRAALGGAHWELDLATWREAFEPARWTCCLAASEEGRAVGFVAACQYRSGPAVIQMLAMEPARQGRGIGSELLARALGAARRAGAREAMAYVAAGDMAARAFYGKAGARLAEELAELDPRSGLVCPAVFELAAP